MEQLNTISLQVKVENDIKDSFSINLLDNQTTVTEIPVRLKYHRILLIKNGSGILYIDEIAYPVSGSEIFLLAKEQIFSFSEHSAVTGYELSFGDCFWEKTPASANNCKAVLFNNVSENQNIPVPTSGYQEMDLLFNILLLEYQNEDYINKQDAMAAYLKIIMIKTANLNASLTNAYDNFEKQIYRQFLELVQSQFHKTHDVSDFAEKLNISTRKLSEICKRNSNKGPKDIISLQIITEAKRALQFSAKPVKEIAFELNFNSAEQFSHFFKKYTQFSPQLYRVGFVKIGM
ncbi:helix-turn-helix domain-containing protein [Dyadobacter subterraneus]|uniref:Helix-turn-helix domain-containing protein n=1 Tax=Dyadobacter subterraneus TaxID=2773304 RepID=A0ABR9WCM3_9BACT|nr:AraC family transcriptional regulator [Dyadobacter subterraneus]MBE9463226.1 helix-turn-helix domain-containing protein [Dyadobacter subterraneus]